MIRKENRSEGVRIVADFEDRAIPLNTSAGLDRTQAALDGGSSGARESDARSFEEAFRELAVQWHKETAMSSSITRKLQHPAYLKIIAMGEKAVPLILRELRDRPGHWFDALRLITKQTPVVPSERADPRKARAAWLKWGKEKGLIE
jgi:hypothetical protein